MQMPSSMGEPCRVRQTVNTLSAVLYVLPSILFGKPCAHHRWNPF